MRYDLPNPFMFHQCSPGLSRASQNTAERDPAVMLDCPGAAARFKLDAEAFMAELDPAPLFLRNVEDDIRELLRAAA